MQPAADQADKVEAVFEGILQKRTQIALQPLILGFGYRQRVNDTGCRAVIMIKATVDILPDKAGDKRIFRPASSAREIWLYGFLVKKRIALERFVGVRVRTI